MDGAALHPLMLVQQHVAELEPLWRLKPDWDVTMLVKFFGLSENVYTLAIFRGDERIGALLLVMDPIYNSLIVDTLVIEPEHRSISTLRDVVQLAAPFTVALARKIGAKKVRVSMRGARKILKWFPHAKVVYETIGRDV